MKIKPQKIRLEASSFCQLRCPSCPTTTRAIHPAVGSGFLKLSDFQKLIANNSFVREIELSNYGEIFLNPELPAIIRCAHENGVVLRADNGVNLNHAKPEVLEALVKYRFASMNCSIDGASQETYEKYRVRGNFHNVMENIRAINRFKREYSSELPLLNWQFVVFGHNEHELETARTLAAELGMTFTPKLSWDAEISPVQDKDKIRVVAGAASRAEFKEKRGEDYAAAICHQLWDAPQINWDGKVLGCCRNFWGDFGTGAFEGGIIAAANGEKMRAARAMLLGKNPSSPPRADIPCTTCEIYLDMATRQKWLRRPPRFQLAPSPQLRQRARARVRDVYLFLRLNHIKSRLQRLRRR
jgi:hypothetical protein